MIFVLALIISGLLAWMGFRKGVYLMAATLFNILLSAYVGILSTPVVLKASPDLETSGYYAAFCMLFLIIGCFAILQGLCYYLFLRGADIIFPPVFDKLGGGLMGFFSGYVLTGLLVLAVCMMPFSRLETLQGIVPWDSMKTFCTGSTVKVCRFVAAWSLVYLDEVPDETVSYLVGLGELCPSPAAETERPSGGGQNSPAPAQDAGAPAQRDTPKPETHL